MEESDAVSEEDEDMVSEHDEEIAQEIAQEKNHRQMFQQEIGGKIFKNECKKNLAKFEKMKAYVDSIIDTGLPWTDSEFPPEFKSLCTDGTAEQFNKCKAYEWTRASEMHEDQVIFRDGIAPSDIR